MNEPTNERNRTRACLNSRRKLVADSATRFDSRSSRFDGVFLTPFESKRWGSSRWTLFSAPAVRAGGRASWGRGRDDLARACAFAAMRVGTRTLCGDEGAPRSTMCLRCPQTVARSPMVARPTNVCVVRGPPMCARSPNGFGRRSAVFESWLTGAHSATHELGGASCLVCDVARWCAWCASGAHAASSSGVLAAMTPPRWRAWRPMIPGGAPGVPGADAASSGSVLTAMTPRWCARRAMTPLVARPVVLLERIATPPTPLGPWRGRARGCALHAARVAARALFSHRSGRTEDDVIDRVADLPAAALRLPPLRPVFAHAPTSAARASFVFHERRLHGSSTRLRAPRVVLEERRRRRARDRVLLVDHDVVRAAAEQEDAPARLCVVRRWHGGGSTDDAAWWEADAHARRLGGFAGEMSECAARVRARTNGENRPAPRNAGDPGPTRRRRALHSDGQNRARHPTPIARESKGAPQRAAVRRLNQGTSEPSSLLETPPISRCGARAGGKVGAVAPGGRRPLLRPRWGFGRSPFPHTYEPDKRKQQTELVKVRGNRKLGCHNDVLHPFFAPRVPKTSSSRAFFYPSLTEGGARPPAVVP